MYRLRGAENRGAELVLTAATRPGKPKRASERLDVHKRERLRVHAAGRDYRGMKPWHAVNRSHPSSPFSLPSGTGAIGHLS